MFGTEVHKGLALENRIIQADNRVGLAMQRSRYKATGWMKTDMLYDLQGKECPVNKEKVSG